MCIRDRFASDLDEATRKQLERGQRVTELMKQKQYSPLNVGEMAISLYAANEGYLDELDINQVVPFEEGLHAHVRSGHQGVLDTINEAGDYNDDIEAGMKAAIDDFVANGVY